MNANRFSIIAVLLFGILLTGCSPDPLSGILTDLPFDAPEISMPVFPDRDFPVEEYGAVGDGHTLNTAAFAAAIEACTNAGGGRVVVPEGIWLTGPIKFESNVNLHLEMGSTLQFTGKFEDYPLMRGTWEGKAEVRCVSPIFGKDLENIAITGHGVIDGAGDKWRPVKKYKLTERGWKKLVKSGGAVTDDGKVWWPSKGAMNGRALVNELNAKGNAEVADYAPAREYLRPVMVNFVECKNILLDGPTFQNSPAWNIHPLLCDNIIIQNINVRNPWYSQNGDGLDLESCTNALVYNSRFDVGDDAICIKSGKNEYGRERGRPTENVVIKDCTVYHGHGGFTVGSEMSGGVRNIYVENCTFLGTDVGLRFKSTRGRGGVVENIFIKDIYMEDIVMEAIRFNMFYAMKEPIPEVGSDGLALFKEVPADPVTEVTPSFRDIYMDNIVCSGAGQAVLLYGLPEMAIRNIQMSNMKMTAEKGVICVDADEIGLKNMDIAVSREPAVMLLNSRNIDIDGVKLPAGTKSFLLAEGSKSGKVTISNHGGSVTRDLIATGKIVDPGNIVIN